MKKIIVSNEIITLSDKIATKSVKEANCFPVDRFFLKPYLPEILSFNTNEFFLYNFERVNNTYTIQLMLCLPELWQRTSMSDITQLISNFTNMHSYYAIIKFMHKYIEVDILRLILNFNFISSDTKDNIISFISQQYQDLYKDNGDYIFFGQNPDNENLYGVTLEEWENIKQHFFKEGFKPCMDKFELKNYLLQINP